MYSFLYRLSNNTYKTAYIHIRYSVYNIYKIFLERLCVVTKQVPCVQSNCRKQEL